MCVYLGGIEARGGEGGGEGDEQFNSAMDEFHNNVLCVLALCVFSSSFLVRFVLFSQNGSS